MATEEQLVNNVSISIRSTGPVRAGQKLPILARRVQRLSFLLKKTGLPTGTVTFTIRKFSDKSLIASKDWGDAGDLTLGNVWREVILDAPVDVNESAIILVEFAGGDNANTVGMAAQNTDVKAGENYIQYESGAWGEVGTYDVAYIYTYELTPTPPTVTIQAMTDMGRNTAKGHGNVTALGVPNPTAHGHCWNRTGAPDTSDSKTDLGAKDATGAFESDLPDLSPGKTYYVRSYATNDGGTSYSDEINFTTRTGLSRRYENLITGQDDLGSVYAAVWSAETFTPDVEHPILKVRLLLYRVGNPGDLTASIRATAAGLPTGVDLCYGTIDGNALTTDVGGEWYEIEFDLGTIQDLLASGTLFAIVFRAPDGVSPTDIVVAHGTSTDQYAGGQRCSSVNGGVDWNLVGVGTHDLLFQEWGTVLGGAGLNPALLEML